MEGSSSLWNSNPNPHACARRAVAFPTEPFIDDRSRTLLACCGAEICRTCVTDSEGQDLRVLCQSTECMGPREAHACTLRHAEEGQVWAARFVGLQLVLGEGCTLSEKKAVKWFRQAAEAGHPRAQNALGIMYRLGKGGLRRDMGQARIWFEKSAANKYGVGALNLAELYSSEGKMYQAMELFRKLAKAGNLAALRGLGDCLFQHGDVKQASKWYLQGALQEDPMSIRNLVGCYFLQPPQRMALAMYWMGMLADTGDSEAESRLQSCE